MSSTSKAPFGIRLAVSDHEKIEEVISKVPSLTKSKIVSTAVAHFIESGQLDQLVEQETFKRRTPA